MYLKNLTVLGFKSFADKTSLNFQPGVTAIVGPNGCGKSNVSDAIRWVLGEQSAKALRGGEMADVIFNGTDSRKPLGMAEVSLTIGDIDEEHLKAAGVEIAYNEVTLTRRVFRDGGSEYFINKTPCRLKDIQQLFMGTGVGRTSYSIMAQGNITQILSSKPDDRRMVFEEAAGITKFKAQKKEALRKLEYTDQNLLRVADLIREVKRQIGSLQRQAGKARRYKALMIELQHLETQFARHQFDVLQGEIAERHATVEKLRAEIEVSSEKVIRVENEIIQLRERLSELEQEIGQAQQHGLELKAQSDRHESRINFNDERLVELETQHGKALHEIAEAEERASISEQELNSVAERLATSTAKLETQRQLLGQKREALQQVEDDLRDQQEVLRQLQSEAFGSAQQLSRVRNEINAVDLQKQGNLVRLEKLASEKIQLHEEQSRLQTRLQEFAAHVETEKVNVQHSRGNVEERQQRLGQIQGELNEIGHQLDGVLRQQAATRSRLNVLEQLQSEHEGFDAGALAALHQSQSVLGTLADRIRVSDRFIPAIGAALGHHLQLVLTENPEDAQGILADLNTNHKGRASIGTLGLRQAQPLVETQPEAGGYISASSVVDADPSVGALIQRLLGSTRIVPNLAAATAAWKDCDGTFDFVTETGELLTRHGVYTGGYANGTGKAPASILGRKNQIAELNHALSEVQEQIAEVSRRKGALQSEQTELQASLQAAQTELRAQEVAIATRQGEFNALEASQRSLQQKIETVEFELQTLTAQEQEGLQKRAALSAEISRLESRDQQLQSEVSTQTNNLEHLRHHREAANTALTETKVGLASEEQVCAALRQQQQPLQQRIQELRHLAAQRRQEIGGFAARKDQWLAEIEESRRQMDRLRHEREIASTQVAELVSQKDSQESEILTREDDLREQRKRLNDFQQQRGTLDVEIAQKTMGVQNLRERIQQKYQLLLDDIRSECITITIADDGPAKVQTLTPEEMAEAGLSTDWNMVAEQATALQKRIDEIGPVNLVAIDEYEETEQRHQFLSTQHDDLTQAKEQLIEVINRINRQTQEMFTETFNRIRDNFRVLFTEIFGGGKADLLMVNEGDALESGIDIVARPPGKQLQNISLLSGGEQTMTAVALLFSIYQVKPSPFCVLDELDAPLDESNINRFVRVLQRFLVHSQFVIITHNKRTIGIADILYGVTMQERGISKIVSVKFHKSGEEVNDRVATPLVAEGPSATDEAREESEDVVMAK